MSKVILRPIEVKCRDGVTPSSFSFRGRRLGVKQVWERWKDTGAWWEGESPKLFFRVEAADGSLWELYQDLEQKRWFLYKVYD